MAKIAEKVFWKVMEECGGHFSMATNIFKEEYGVEISRQAVRTRAKRKPEKLREIEEMSVEMASETIFDVMKNGENGNTRRLAAESYLKYKGHLLGYVENSKIDVTSNGETVGQMPSIVLIKRSSDDKDS